jgi:hypothetical protein
MRAIRLPRVQAAMEVHSPPLCSIWGLPPHARSQNQPIHCIIGFASFQPVERLIVRHKAAAHEKRSTKDTDSLSR